MVIANLEKEYKKLEEKHKRLQAEQTPPKLSSDEANEIKNRSFAIANLMELYEEETRELIDAQLRLAGLGS